MMNKLFDRSNWIIEVTIPDKTRIIKGKSRLTEKGHILKAKK